MSGIPFDPRSQFERRRLIAHVLLESTSGRFEWELAAHVLSGGELSVFAAASGLSEWNLSRSLRALAWRASFVLHPTISPYSVLHVTDSPLLLQLLRAFDPIRRFHRRELPKGIYEEIYGDVARHVRPGIKAGQLQQVLFESSVCWLDQYGLTVGLYVWEIPALWAHRVLHGTYLSTRSEAPRFIRRALRDRKPWRPKKKR